MTPTLLLALLAQQAAQPAAELTPFPANDPNAVQSLPVELDDSVPLPIPAVFEPGPDGDRLVEPASGDPFFLSFTAGDYFPPKGERIDPELLSQLRSRWNDGRPTQETYAFVMFERRITPARLDALRSLGVRVLEFHPHYSMKVALTPALVDAVAALDFVRWIGVPRRAQKVHRAMGEAFASLRPGELAEGYISVFDSDLCADSTWRAVGTLEQGGPDGVTRIDDPARLPKVWMSNGWQQRELEALGLEVMEYVDSIRAFRVRFAPAQVELAAELDFVQFIEPHGTPKLQHDESMPMVLADYTRRFYPGATPAIAGQGDSGIEYSHSDLTGFFWTASNLSGSAEATTDDICGHGTHVAGTIMGGGVIDASHEGAARSLGGTTTTRFFNTKLFYGAGCWYGGSSMATVFGTFDSSITDGSGNVTPRPHAINQSWGTPSPAGGSFGSEADCRTIDASIYSFPQLHVFAAGNDGPGASTVNVESSAKNVFTVGGVRDYASGAEDPGEMYTSSARGPLADGRWKPNISAPATSIMSCDADNLTGYTSKSGTSMAAPHVTGIAAQLMDHQTFLHHNPTTTGALLMASAVTKDNILLQTPTSTHLDNWGAGRVDAYKAHYGPGGVYFWGWTQGTGAGTYVDLPVSTGATRIVVCLYYHEAASSAGAGTALVNDLDLWIDSPTGGISATTNSGEYTAQQSSLDNTELRMIDNPVVGTWRVKVHPDSVTSNTRVGVAVLVHYDDTTPDGTFNVTASKLAIKPNENVDITATAFNPEYVASAVYLDSTSTGDTLVASVGELDDFAAVDYMGNQQGGRDVLLGSIRPNASRSATWTTRWATEGFKGFSVSARSDNWVNKNDLAAIVVDGTPPPLPTLIGSNTHPAGTWVNSNAFTASWVQTQDALSGMAGYSIGLTVIPLLPDTTADAGTATNYAATLPGTSGTYYLCLRPVDRSGNWPASFAQYGPIRYDGVQPGGITGLTSPTHALNSYRCNGNVTVVWNTMTDLGGSGVAGASYLWDHNPVTQPDSTVESSPAATSYATLLGASAQPWYFHITPYDNAGNGQNMYHYGPIYITPATPTTYCTGKTNSLGCVPAISTTGSPSLSAGNLQVQCSNVLNQKNGLLFFGFASNAAPFQGGTLCIAPPTIRTQNQSSGGAVLGNSCTGSYSFAFTPSVMATYGIDAGETVHVQWWMRDPASPSTTGLSNAAQFTVCQ
ncbi:MAG: S8 family serine peptidase [Planctomycetota bacterium]|nr:S8 family serine peptidase [Planctomycetota bacterium]